MRTSTKGAWTGGNSPHSFRSPPAAFTCLRHDRMAPSPELSINCNWPTSNTTLELASSTGAMWRLNCGTLLASSSPNRATTVTSPIFSTLNTIGIASLAGVFRFFYQTNRVSPPLIARIAHLIDRLGDEVHAKAALARAVKRRRLDRLWVKCLPAMREPEGDTVSERVRFDLNRLIGATAIRMFHDVTGSFIDRQFELADVILVQDR